MLDVVDYDYISDDNLANAVLSLDEVLPRKGQDVSVPKWINRFIDLNSANGMQISSQLYIQVTYLPEKLNLKADSLTYPEVSDPPVTQKIITGHFEFTIISAKSLEDKDTFNKSDPYVVLKLNKQPLNKDKGP